MSKKIAITTIYNENRNYGGVLQAYALHKKLADMGYNTEHLKFNGNAPIYKKLTPKQRISSILSKKPSQILSRLLDKFSLTIYKYFKKSDLKLVDEFVKGRNKAFEHFQNDLIPHNDKVYDEDTISETLSLYDIFITGSDQVWNPIGYNSIYRLDFVPNQVPKFSYAASVSNTFLTQEQQETFKKSLKGYIGVSVRENETVNLLKPLSPVKPINSLDPTLLLTVTEWDEVCAEKLVNESYVFCYFLNTGGNLRRVAKKYAKKHGLKVVTIPYLMSKYNYWDKKCSDIFIAEASPEKFISLIKNAQAVFTDSFHASVFSCIYEKLFFAFRREGYPGMNIRLKTLTELFGVEKHFCDQDKKEKLSYINSNNTIDYKNKNPYEEMRKSSILYLKEMLEKSENIIRQNENYSIGKKGSINDNN